MGSPERVAALYSSSSTAGGSGADGTFAKRQRTKRLRTLSSSPPPPEEEEDYSSTTTATEEEEDTAHCLILLAQGRAFGEADSRRRAETTPASAAAKLAAGSYAAYECRTCNRRFPSFQALGGHRTSHKKPRPAAAASPGRDGPETTSTSSSATASLVVVVPAGDVGRSRPHECSICGSEFASGQALGGHMRRHRPLQGPTVAPCGGSSTAPKERSVLLLSLDLNLPAPPEEDVSRNNTFAAFGDRRPMARPLVDCHY